jgi:hypothetical protein
MAGWRTLRWIARGWSIASVGFLLLFIFGEGLAPGQLTAAEWAQATFFPLGVAAGMILGWRWELKGGAVAAGSLVVFYLLHLLTGHGWPRGPWFLLVTMPGILFLICGWRNLRT